jgi:MFS family permease
MDDNCNTAHETGNQTLNLEKERELDPRSLSFDTTIQPEPTKSSLPTNADEFASLPPLRKNILYVVVTIAMATDTLGESCFFVSTEQIARDMNLAQGGNAIWIISAYAMAFAACIPLAGRLCDVFPAQWWYLGGFVGMSGFTLGNSFGKPVCAFSSIEAHCEYLLRWSCIFGIAAEREAFLALRTLQGICAALTLPSGCSVIWACGTISGFVM